MKLRRTSRRLLSALAAVAAGVVGVFVVASPAQAHNAYIVATPYCDGEQAKVDFKISSQFHWDSNHVEIFNIGGDFTAGQLGINTTELIPIPQGEDPAVIKEITGVSLSGTPGDTLDVTVTLKWYFKNNDGTWEKDGANPTHSTEFDIPDCDVPETVRFDPTCDTISVHFHSDVAKVFVLRDKDGNLIKQSDSAVNDFSVPDVSWDKAPLKAYYVSDQQEILIEEYTEGPPPYCGDPGLVVESTCEGLTVTLINPEDGKQEEVSRTFTPSTGDPVTLTAARGKTVSHTFPGTDGLTVSFLPLDGGDEATAKWEPEDCETTTTTPGLPDTGTGGLGGIVAAGAALVLAGAGLLTMLFLRRRRASAES